MQKKLLTVSREYGILKKFSGTLWGISSVGRAPALQAGGHEFDSRILHFQMEDNKEGFVFMRYKSGSFFCIHVKRTVRTLKNSVQL